MLKTLAVYSSLHRDETTYNRTKMVTGGKREKNVGGIGALGGVTADAALGNGYSTEMSFKCI